MEKFTINYGTMKEEFAGTIEEAKEHAENNAAYTGLPVVISSQDGEEITRAEWYGVEPEHETDIVLVQYGSYGFYQVWSDELENL